MKSLFTLVLALATLLGNKLQADQQKPNVLFLSIDDLKPALGCYNYPLIKTPNIDRLARRGVLFEHHYVQLAICGPSRASMFTGLRPDTTRIWDLKHTESYAPQEAYAPEEEAYVQEEAYSPQESYAPQEAYAPEEEAYVQQAPPSTQPYDPLGVPVASAKPLEYYPEAGAPANQVYEDPAQAEVYQQQQAYPPAETYAQPQGFQPPPPAQAPPTGFHRC